MQGSVPRGAGRAGVSSLSYVGFRRAGAAACLYAALVLTRTAVTARDVAGPRATAPTLPEDEVAALKTKTHRRTWGKGRSRKILSRWEMEETQENGGASKQLTSYKNDSSGSSEQPDTPGLHLQGGLKWLSKTEIQTCLMGQAPSWT